MQDSAPQSPQETPDAPEAAGTVSGTQAPLALPAPPERPSKPNGAAPPAKRRGGRPKGSRNPDKLAIRRWMSPKAKKLTLKQIRIAHEIFDAALAGDTVTDARLEFAGSVAKQAREYSFGKPTEHREISGPDGGPITTEALLPMEQMQRLGALFAAHQAQQPAAPPGEPAPPVIDVEAEPIDGPEKREEGGGGASQAAPAACADD